MLSGNGRHRRPRQAPALLVAAGVTGSAIAIPLLGASGASAADGTVWDKVAECETGGSWSATDLARGEYGGLSLTQDDWERYGGLDYAPSADQASRNQQIAVAQKVLAAQGVGAWGTCGLTSGLSEATGALDVDTGVADDASGKPVSGGLSDSSKESSGGSGSSNSSSPSNGSSDSSGSSVDPSVSADPNTVSPSPSSSSMADDSATSDPSTGAGLTQGPDGSPTVSPDTANADKSGQAEGSWSLVDTGTLGTGRHRGASADETPATGTGSSAPAPAAADAYTVRAGDSLASIADSLDVSGGWHALYERNRDVIGADPSSIVPGQTLSVAGE